MEHGYVAIIQAGGKGTRMRDLTHDTIPKPMLKINGIPIIERQIISLKDYGIKEFIIIVGYLGEVIENYFQDGSKWNLRISYIRETEPLGSGGALYLAKEMVSGNDAILVFGDVVYDLEWDRFLRFHQKNDALVTLLAHPNSHPYDSDLLILGENNRVLEIDSKNNYRDYYYNNCVNAGISILSYELISRLGSPRAADYEADIIRPFLNTGRVFAYNTTEYAKDVGTPERFRKACEEQNKGIWKARCLANKQKAIFLDRDGTINILKGFIHSADQFELLPKVVEAILLINNSDYLCIVITNQPVIARGDCSLEELNRIHMKLQTLLGNKGAYVNDILFCPHHPDKGYEGEVTELKIHCDCRKPNIGLLRDAGEKYNLDLSKCWFVGDTTVDIQTGKNAGCRTALVKTGEAGHDGKYSSVPTLYADTLLDVVNAIIKGDNDAVS